jgi:hypothetical protein
MAQQTTTQLPVGTRVTVSYAVKGHSAQPTQGSITVKSTAWAANVSLHGLGSTVAINLPWSEVSKNEHRAFRVAEDENTVTITEVEPKNSHPMNWAGMSETTREGAWDFARARGLRTVFVSRDGIAQELGQVFSPKTFERAAYWGYVGYGRSMTDGYYAPIDFDAWVTDFRRFPSFGQNDVAEAVKAALPKYFAALAQAGIR